VDGGGIVKAKEVYDADEAAKELGIKYSRLVRWIRAGKVAAKKSGPGLTNPWLLHVTEVKRLKEVFAPPTAATCGR
jgi:predicted site-specific integrase-resolvase